MTNFDKNFSIEWQNILRQPLQQTVKRSKHVTIVFSESKTIFSTAILMVFVALLITVSQITYFTTELNYGGLHINQQK